MASLARILKPQVNTEVRFLDSETGEDVVVNVKHSPQFMTPEFEATYRGISKEAGDGEASANEKFVRMFLMVVKSWDFRWFDQEIVKVIAKQSGGYLANLDPDKAFANDGSSIPPLIFSSTREAEAALAEVGYSGPVLYEWGAGRIIPLTYEAVSKIPYDILSEFMSQIMDSDSPNQPTETGSGNSSQPEASGDKFPNGTN